MREVLNRLEALGLRWFLTASEAASRYGVLRRTYDTDIVVDREPGAFASIAAGFVVNHSIADEIDYGEFSMGSLVSRETVVKVDLIFRRKTAWTESTMSRRKRLPHPSLGLPWVSSLEDLVLAKLIWSEGTSELQLRDCGMLVRVNAERIDHSYLDRWAPILGVTSLLEQVRHAP